MASAVHTSLVSIICLSASVSWAAELQEVGPGDEVSLLQSRLDFLNAQASATPRAGPQAQGIPTFYVDLDAEPEQRWQNVTSHWLERNTYPQMLRRGPLNPFAKELLQVMEVDEEYLREMRGIVAQINDPEVSVDSLILESVGYELSGSVDDPSFLPQKSSIGCSGLLAAMPNGTVVHGRNMDLLGFEYTGKDGRVYRYSYPDVTVEVVFVKAGKPLITSAHWPGQTGIHTAMRYGGWSFEQNTRFHGARTSLLYGLVQGSGGFMLRARKVMEQVEDFETAVQQLAASNVMAPQYFIMAGPEPYQGAVITMDRGGEHLNGTPPVRRVSSDLPVLKDGQSYEGWYVFQTNDDMGGMPVDLRTPTEQVRLRRSRQEMVSTDWVYDQLTTPPVFNDGTVFTTMYVPATGYHSTTVWPEHAR